MRTWFYVEDLNLTQTELRKLEKKVVVCVSALAKYTSRDSVTWSMVDKCVRPIASSDMIHIIFAKDFCKRQRKFKYTTERQSFRYGSVKRFKSRQVLEVATLIVMLFFFTVNVLVVWRSLRMKQCNAQFLIGTYLILRWDEFLFLFALLRLSHGP